MSLTPGSYIHIRKESSHTSSELLPGRILWSHGSLVAAEMDSRAITGANEQKLTLLYEQNHKFVQQPTLLEGVIDQEAADAPTAADLTAMDMEPSTQRVVVVFELLGEPAVAENRECYRVRATPDGISVKFAGRADCELSDISQIGFSLISGDDIQPGAIVQVSLPTSSATVRGSVRIQSVRRLRDGRFRYGVVCMGRRMGQACSQLATELQRQQLLRLAGRT